MYETNFYNMKNAISKILVKWDLEELMTNYNLGNQQNKCALNV